MPSLADTIARLAAKRGAARAPAYRMALVELTHFGTNPGALRAWTHVPADLADGAPLVVVLHGCTQTAAGYDAGAGWSRLADRHGFALLSPDQRRANNLNLCFSWFSPADNRRDGGEAASIRQMVEATAAWHAIDPARIFVTGLLAAGDMALIMLATYPEVFAGGAVIAGLPYGCAANVPQALERMQGQGLPDAAALNGLARAASSHQGAWPTLSVWHGSADATVNPNNADAIVDRWRGLHGLGPSAGRTEAVTATRAAPGVTRASAR